MEWSRKRLVSYLLLLLLAVLVTMLIHELGHYLMGVLLGNEMEMDLNGTRPVSGFFSQDWHLPLVVLSGPLFTLGQALIFYLLVSKRKGFYYYPFLFYPALYRTVPYLFSLLAEERFALQDKVQLANYYNLNPWPIIVIFLLLLIIMAGKGSRRLKVGWRINLLTLIFSLLYTLFWLQFNRLFIV